MYGIPGTRIVGVAADADIHCLTCTPYDVWDDHAEDSDGNPVHPIFACSEDVGNTYCSACGRPLIGD